MTLGERLKQFRELAGVSQNELAKRAGISRPIISDLESNKQKGMALDTAQRLAKALNVTLDMFVGESEGSKTEDAAPVFA